MRLSDLDYDLPPGAVAQVPAEPRDSARLLDATGPEIAHRLVRDLPDVLGPGDLLVVNETRVRRARLALRKATGGAAEVLLLEPVGDGWWEALVRPGRRLPPSTVLLAGTQPVVEVGEVVDPGEGTRRVRLLVDDPEPYGALPLPPYIERPLEDPERYQTVYAAVPGSAAAPTAGLHLTAEVLDRCRRRGAAVAPVDLVVGLATFRPVTAEDPLTHPIHEEAYRVPEATMAACRAARRVVAVGTTTVRALEAAARGPLAGRTGLFIHPPFDFRVVDVLMTNFHLPRSSLLLLVEAFVGPRWRQLYAGALAEGYRFLSFGDAMLLARAT